MRTTEGTLRTRGRVRRGKNVMWVWEGKNGKGVREAWEGGTGIREAPLLRQWAWGQRPNREGGPPWRAHLDRLNPSNRGKLVGSLTGGPRRWVDGNLQYGGRGGASTLWAHSSSAVFMAMCG